jgi:hypothetical protein
MSIFKKLLVFALIGALIGDIAAMVIAPGMVAWYETAGDSGAMCNCLIIARLTTARFVKAQAIGAGLGAVIFLMIGILVVRGGRHRPVQPSTPPAPPS